MDNEQRIAAIFDELNRTKPTPVGTVWTTGKVVFAVLVALCLFPIALALVITCWPGFLLLTAIIGLIHYAARVFASEQRRP